MKVLFDTDVVLDVMLDREPFAEPAIQLFAMVETAEIVGILGATTVTAIYYLATKVIGTEQAQTEVQKLLTLFEVAPVNRMVLEAAIRSSFSDFGDVVLYEAARHAGAHSIVTRDLIGFKRSALAVYSPRELLRMFKALKETE